MIKAMLISVLVGSCALYARANTAYPLEGSSQDFAGYTVGATGVYSNLESGVSYWSAPEDTTLTSATIVNDGADGKCLSISASDHPDMSLVRTMVPRADWQSSVSNAFISSGAYSGVYCDLVTTIMTFDDGESPELDEFDRLVIWSRENGIYITAGRLEGAERKVVAHNYRVVTPVIADPEDFHRITVRAIPEIVSGAKALGFEVWIDGVRAVTAADDPVVVDVDRSQLTAEALALIAEHCLFPALVKSGLDTAVSLSGIGFSGAGKIDRIAFSPSAPETWAVAPRAFTLRWDAGVSRIAYSFVPGVTNEVPAASIPDRFTVFEIPSAATDIAVSAEYNTVAEYSQGYWTSEGACSVVTNGLPSAPKYSFRCDASANPGTGCVRSFRKEIGLGGGAGKFHSFSEAKQQALAQGAGVIVLDDDFAPVDEEQDESTAIVINPGETVKIDLNGHSITNAAGEWPTIINRGNLTIIDSSATGTGRVASYVGVGEGQDFERTAVDSHTDKSFHPVLNIKGGVFDGVVVVSGSVTNALGTVFETAFTIYPSEYASGVPAFRSDEGGAFEFAENVYTNNLYFVYDGAYWRPLGGDAFIWCGEGWNDSWYTPDNWKNRQVPPSGANVVFPYTPEPWKVDLDAVVIDQHLLLAGDVEFIDEADFTAASWDDSAAGRVSGDARLIWNGALPGNLSTFLASSWAGEVNVRDVGNAASGINSTPKLMKDLATWGTESSVVVFKGVRGYYHQPGSLVLPYTLKLESGSGDYAWKNDAGFTGGIIVFPKLIGDGRFVSPANLIANQQIIAFRDIMDYTGVFEVKGKRVVLGPGNVKTPEAGSITWSDGMELKAVAVHDCRVAAFGAAIDVTGNFGDALTTYDPGFEPIGYDTALITLQPTAARAELCVTNPVGTVKIVPLSRTLVDGAPMSSGAPLRATSRTSIIAPDAARAMSLPVAEHYDRIISTNEDHTVSVRLALNQNAVPVIGAQGGESASITFADGMASIVVTGAMEGLWYGLEYKSSLDAEWPAEPYIWSTRMPGLEDRIELVAPAEGPSGFYRVVVTDLIPEGGVK